MCGIVAVHRFDGAEVDGGRLREMRDVMLHRGPDDADLYLDGPIGLGHRRLSIVDLSRAGRQPMCNEDRSLWLVCNGEIYNFIELRNELRQRGHHFASSSDSEVILHLYEELGEACLERLNGMFAFVLWDARRRVLFAARDRIGIKPLHYYRDGTQFICASEAKAILADPSVPRRPELRTLADYLYCGQPLGGRTAFEGIHELPPGHLLRVTDAGVRIEKYWDITYAYDYTRTDAQLREQMSTLLDDAVRVHSRSDAPVGCHLSGGLDSSTVTGLAARHYEPLQTFSIRFGEGGYFDETAHAGAVSRRLGAAHRVDTPDAGDFRQLFPALLWHLETPMMNAGGYSYFTISRLAARHVKVALTGHGGDELFAGYPAQFQAAFGTTAAFDGSASPPPLPGASPWVERWERLRAHGVAGLLRRVQRRLRPATPSFERRWAALHCGAAPAENPLLHREFLGRLGGYDPYADYIAPLTAAATDQPLDRGLYHDLRLYLPGLLQMEDRLSMAVSLESRVPLLDHRLVELMATVPPEQKVRGMEPKAVLRAAAGALLPAEVYSGAQKRPFPVPVYSWMATELAPMLREVLTAPQALDRGIFRPDRLRKLNLQPEEMWLALNVEMWFRVFIDGSAARQRLVAAERPRAQGRGEGKLVSVR